MVTSAPLPETTPRLVGSTAAANDDLPTGLTSDEARRRLEKFGPNAMPDTALHPLRSAMEKFWAPVPWMLEAAIVLELALGNYVEAAIIAALLVFNAALGLFQESRAKHGSWLNLIEGFFSKLARSVLRHIRVASKQELKDRIMAAIDDVNRHPVVHTWSYRLEDAA
jgi:Cation transporter/ATPase, N-terminus